MSERPENPTEIGKDLKMSAEAAVLAMNVQAYAIVRLNKFGEVTVSTDAGIGELCYMKEVFQSFVNKTISSMALNNAPQKS